MKSVKVCKDMTNTIYGANITCHDDYDYDYDYDYDAGQGRREGVRGGRSEGSMSTILNPIPFAASDITHQYEILED